MNNEIMTDKMAKEAFYDEKIQESWKAHTKVFGKILEPAFTDNLKARVFLTVALNKICNQDIQGGLFKLKQIGNACVTDADKAAWYFCVGLAHEMAGNRGEMIALYQEAGRCGHDFYLPYLKVAKCAYEDGVYDLAKENYLFAIRSLKNLETSVQTQGMLASAYSNLASCLTMMHNFDQAQEVLKISRKMVTALRGRDSIEAILLAAKGNAEEAKMCVAALKNNDPALYNQCKEVVDAIIDGKHPHFCPLEVEEKKIVEFWKWFVDNQKVLEEKMENQAVTEVHDQIQSKMTEVFPFMKRSVEFGLEKVTDGYKVILADFYMVSLAKGFEALLAECPKEVKVRWNFVLDH